MDNSRICSITTKELDVGQSLARRWFDRLVAAGLARRAPSRRNGTLLFSPLAKEFLQWRSGQSGHPSFSLEKVLSAWLKLKEQGYIIITAHRVLWEIANTEPKEAKDNEGTQATLKA